MIIIGGIAACSDSKTSDAPIVKPYVTNAEYVLERIESGESSGVAFQVKPTHRKACKSMYIEIGRQNSEGFWETTNTLFPGKDNRDNFGQTVINDQIHFAEVDGEGQFAVLALGCEPYGDTLKITKGLIATFDVNFGELNYIGEIALITTGIASRRFSAIEVADRSEFALTQIQSQRPALEKHFQPNIMKKYVTEFTPQMQAKFDELYKRLEKIDALTENANRTITVRNKFFEEQKNVQGIIDIWDEKHGYPQKDLTRQQTEDRNKLLRQRGRILRKIERYDDWIDRNIDFALTEKYMALAVAAERAEKDIDDKFPGYLTRSLTEDESNSPEYLTLVNAAWDADAALDEFAERHGM